MRDARALRRSKEKKDLLPGDGRWWGAAMEHVT
jgi:hypothetical protein